MSNLKIHSLQELAGRGSIAAFLAEIEVKGDADDDYEGTALILGRTFMGIGRSTVIKFRDAWLFSDYSPLLETKEQSTQRAVIARQFCYDAACQLFTEPSAHECSVVADIIIKYMDELKDSKPVNPDAERKAMLKQAENSELVIICNDKPLIDARC